MTTRKTVMISSTKQDLIKHREQARLGCSRMGFTLPKMMEHLTAVNADAIGESMRMVEEADIYLGIFGYRYGSIPDGYDISITEMEYNRAVALNKPRLIFIMDDKHPVRRNMVETGPGAKKLEALKDRISKERVVAFFENAYDLRANVVEALSKYAKKMNLDKSECSDMRHSTRLIPQPPGPFIASPYILQIKEFVGRENEFEDLTAWVADPKSAAFAKPVFCYVAIGGMGKSALTWKWFNEVAPLKMKPLAGRLWWSFYEPGSTFEEFVNSALCYVSNESEIAVQSLPWRKRESQLLNHLNEKPYLFVLDGLERLLRAYRSVNAGETAEDESDLPNPKRQTMDPRAGRFLEKLAMGRSSRILITSRIYPCALEDLTVRPLAGVQQRKLHGLSDDDAIFLWGQLCKDGAREKLLPLFRSVENHPLVIKALAARVAKYRKAPGNFLAWLADHPRFDPTSQPVKQRRAYILEYAFAGLSENLLETLRVIAGLRMRVPYDILAHLLIGDNSIFSTDQQLDQALTELEDRGLIGWYREPNLHDIHPIVRGEVRRKTNDDEAKFIYRSIGDYCLAKLKPKSGKDLTISDLKPGAMPTFHALKREEFKTVLDLNLEIELYNALINLSLYDVAWDMYHCVLADAIMLRLAAQREAIGFLEPLFPDGLDGDPALTGGIRQAYALGALGCAYYFAGEPKQAEPLMKRAWASASAQNMGGGWVLDPTNISLPLLDIGALREAIDYIFQSLTLSREHDKREDEAMALQHLGSVLNVSGDYATSLIALSRAKMILNRCGWTVQASVTTSFIAENYLLSGNIHEASITATRARRMATKKTGEIALIHAVLRRGQSELARKNFSSAEKYLNECLIRARAAEYIYAELPTLLAIAKLELCLNNPSEAHRYINELLKIAIDRSYRLRRAEAYNLLAKVARAEGQVSEEIKAARSAYECAWCDGPPYAYQAALNESIKHLTACGANQPNMRAFDESKFSDIPYLEINPRDEFWVDIKINEREDSS